MNEFQRLCTPGSVRTGSCSCRDGLDGHFEAMKPEYEAMIRSVGLKSGWSVLDAGCGGGSFLPLLAELVGATGHICAIDLAPENIARVDALVENGQFPCAVDTRVGNLTSLPYEDNRFDAVWCANITQYLTDDELGNMFAEFRRVVRPGGLVAVKEIDLTVNLSANGKHHYAPLSARLSVQYSRPILKRLKASISQRKIWWPGASWQTLTRLTIS